jgi:methyl coenzyme M reductase beta subunit
VQAEVRHASQALVEVDLVNAGAAEFSQPVQVTLRWQEGRLIAADGLQGFDSAEAGPKAVQFQSRNGLAHLGPGERRNIGWVRLDKETQVQIELGKSLNR